MAASEWLKPVRDGWLACIKEGIKRKKDQFQDDADEAMRFFDGPYDFLYGIKEKAEGKYEDPMSKVSFRMTYNKVAEAVQLFGPSLYSRNPYRQVNPAKAPPLPMLNPNDPQSQMAMQQMQQMELMRGNAIETLANQMQYVLNYTPNELDLRGHSRQVIDECLIKGMGVWWTSPYKPPGSPITLVGSFYDTVDNLIIDPDMETIENAKWVARKRCFPVWEVERRFNIPRGTLRGSMESSMRQASLFHDPDYPDDRKRGDTNDLFVYYEVYSRMGIGHRMRLRPTEELRAMETTLDKFGEHCFLAISEEYHCPLNLTEYDAKERSFDETFGRVQWPTPFWAEHTNPWPFTYVAFHKRPRQVWPMSHMKPAMGEIKFLNWAFSFMADKIKNTSRDFIAVAKSVSEELKSALLNGRDLELLEIEAAHGKRIEEIVSFLQHPQFNGDVYRVIEMVLQLLDQRLGLTELMYGNSGKQIRSASEAQIKGDQIKIRPDDMAECVEDAMTKLARKEAMASRWHLTGQDVAPILGPILAQTWEETVMTADPYRVVLELEYRIEAGSIRKPNKNKQMEDANAALQQWGPMLTQYFGATGDVGPYNALAEVWCKAFDFPVDKLRFNPPPPPQPDPTKQMEMQMKQQEVQMKMQAEQMKVQLLMQKAQLEAQIKSAEAQQKLQLEREKAQVELQLKMVEAQLEMQLQREQAQQEMQLSAAEHRQEMIQDEQQHEQEIEQGQQSFLMEAIQSRIASDQQIRQQKAEGDTKLKLTKAASQQKLKTDKQVGDQKVKQAKAQAAAKPKPKGKK